MAQYEVSTAALVEAEEQLLRLAHGLGEALERLNAVHSKWQDGMPELRRQLADGIDAIDGIAACANNAARTLSGVCEAYAQAERAAFADARPPQAPAPAPGLAPSPASSPAPQIMVGPVDRIMFDETIMPDWLKAVVVKYEIGRPEA